MENNLFEHDMLFVASKLITFENMKKFIDREKLETPKEVQTLQIGFGKRE